MNWLLPAVVVFLILAAWDGHRKGFIKKLVGIVSLVLTLVLTSVASPLVAEFLKEHTGIYAMLQNSINASDAELLDTLQMLGLGDAVSGYLAEQILQTFAFLITLLLVCWRECWCAALRFRWGLRQSSRCFTASISWLAWSLDLGKVCWWSGFSFLWLRSFRLPTGEEKCLP